MLTCAYNFSLNSYNYAIVLKPPQFNINKFHSPLEMNTKLRIYTAQKI